MVRWNSRAVFVEHAVRIHGDRYCYDEVTDEHVKGSYSKIPLTCNACGYKWSPDINKHINVKQGCPSCAGQLKWTREKFIEDAIRIHGGKYNYDEIRDEDVKGATSKVPITCNTCGYRWTPAINGHISAKTGCTQCAGNLKLTLDAVRNRAHNVHGDKFDYSLITEGDINGKDSKIPVKCNTCNYLWFPAISSLLNSDRGCPQCAKRIPYTLDSLKERLHEVHGEKYDYSLVNHYHVETTQSKIPVICRKCDKIWEVRINNHIYKSTGCPNCTPSRSKGEIEISEILNSLISTGIINSYSIEYMYSEISEISRRTVDFICSITRHDGTPTCLFIEYDGAQHFEKVRYFRDDLIGIQETDIKKTFLPLYKWPGACMLRIDHKLYPQNRQIINEVIEYVKTDPMKRLFLYSKYDDYDHLLDSDLNRLAHTEIHYESTYGSE